MNFHDNFIGIATVSKSLGTNPSEIKKQLKELDIIPYYTPLTTAILTKEQVNIIRNKFYPGHKDNILWEME